MFRRRHHAKGDRGVTLVGLMLFGYNTLPTRLATLIFFDKESEEKYNSYGFLAYESILIGLRCDPAQLLRHTSSDKVHCHPIVIPPSSRRDGATPPPSG